MTTTLDEQLDTSSTHPNVPPTTNGTKAATEAAATSALRRTSPAASGRFVWYDIRALADHPHLDGLLDAAMRLRPAGVVVDDAMVERVPGGLRTVRIVAGCPSDQELNELRTRYDVLVFEAGVVAGKWYLEHRDELGVGVGAFVDVVDPDSLQQAVELTHRLPLVLVSFRDSTKIPLEIVLAEAQNYGCEVVMGVADHVEANVVFGVLECGAAGVMSTVADLAEIHALDEVITAVEHTHSQQLQSLVIRETRHVGMGERACLDFTSFLGLDEGVLLGCFSGGGILATSETHALPYMPTRPFRVNAGSLQMYVLAPNNQTWYLSDLRAGMELLAVKTDGTARPVTVGRVKIERRPMLQILAEAADGTLVTTIMQEDWHVRVFGNDGKPRNITELRAGDRVLGYTTDPGRHVGVKVSELIIEQ